MRIPMLAILFIFVALVASACATTQPITEPVAVIEAFYEALNDGDLDTAMGFVADDASFMIVGPSTTTTYTGPAQIQDYFQRVVNRNTQHELSDLILEDDTVTWILGATSILGESSGATEAVVQGGKIVSFRTRMFSLT